MKQCMKPFRVCFHVLLLKTQRKNDYLRNDKKICLRQKL